MDRINFYKKVVVNNVAERDFLWHNLSKFKIKRPVDYYRVSQDEIGRMDLISYRVYGTVRYWWLIAVVNGIFNPLLDLKEGQTLKIPNILDIYDFCSEYGSIL